MNLHGEEINKIAFGGILHESGTCYIWLFLVHRDTETCVDVVSIIPHPYDPPRGGEILLGKKEKKRIKKENSSRTE